MTRRSMQHWATVLKPYTRPSYARALFQMLNSAVPFVVLWLLAYAALDYSYAITLLLAVPTAGFMVRLFIFQHDCGHGSFLPWRRANNILGFLLGVLTLTPYGYWKRTHAVHHATSGDLDHRDFGDVRTLTVREYRGLSRRGRLSYRLYRNPLILLGIGPAFQFILKHRFPFDLPRAWKREWASVLWNNLALAVVVVVMWKSVGIRAFLAVQLPIVLIAMGAGVWLFYIQHQFEDTYWERHADWDYGEAGLRGSSYYKLPAVLQWFTGNIGLHQIHHLSSRIPNYHLRRCLRENPELGKVTQLTLWSSLKCARLKLWDEERKKLVGFSDLTSMQSPP